MPRRTAWSRTKEATWEEKGGRGRLHGEATWEEKDGAAQGAREAREDREEEGEAI